MPVQTAEKDETAFQNIETGMEWTQHSNVLCNSNNPQVYALCQKKYTILSASYRVTVLERTAVPSEGEIQCVASAHRYITPYCVLDFHTVTVDVEGISRKPNE